MFFLENGFRLLKNLSQFHSFISDLLLLSVLIAHPWMRFRLMTSDLLSLWKLFAAEFTAKCFFFFVRIRILFSHYKLIIFLTLKISFFWCSNFRLFHFRLRQKDKCWRVRRWYLLRAFILMKQMVLWLKFLWIQSTRLHYFLNVW